MIEKFRNVPIIAYKSKTQGNGHCLITPIAAVWKNILIHKAIEISGGNTIYQAGNIIDLNPGFEVTNGVVYLTKLLAGCIENLSEIL